MIWSKKQNQFLDLACEGINIPLKIFLTGKAGTGKTTVLRELFNILDKKRVSYIKLATTGVAASLFKGQTLHSFYAVPPYNILTETEGIFVRKDTRNLWNKCKFVVIDEASMLRPDQLDFIDKQLLKNNCRSLSTKTIIFVGDFKQLPPITRGISKEILCENYDKVDFRQAHCLAQEVLHLIELDEIHRQKDIDFINALNEVRDTGKSNYFDNFPSSFNEGVMLCPYKSQVNDYNIKYLDSIDQPLHIVKADVKGKIKAGDVVVPLELKFKVGAKVMYLMNKGKFCNGDIGEIIEERNVFYFANEKGRIQLKKESFEKSKYVLNKDGLLELVCVGFIKQIPIQLAWAITIHKAQGQTFDKVCVDMSRPMFAKNQLYVALSRCTSPKGLSIKKN